MADLTMCEIIVFDLDDTLFLERDYVRSGFRAVDEWLKAEGILDDFLALAWEKFQRGIRGNIFNSVFDSRRRELSNPLLNNLIEIYRSHRPQISLFPDAHRLLDQMAKHKRRALISDGPLRSQELKVEALGLSARLDTILLTDAWGKEFWKPHKRAFETIEHAHAGIPPERIAYIADNPLKDFVTPRARGWRTVHICRVNGEYSKTKVSSGFEADDKVASLDYVEVG